MSDIVGQARVTMLPMLCYECANFPTFYWLLLRPACNASHAICWRTVEAVTFDRVRDLWPNHFTPRQSYRIRGNDVTQSRSSQGSLGIKWRCQSAIFLLDNNIFLPSELSATNDTHFTSNNWNFNKMQFKSV